MSTCDPSRRYDSVQQDWRAFLPEAKAQFFYTQTAELEHAYDAFGISLNEAIELRGKFKSAQAFETIAVCSDLSSILALHINSVLHCMRQRGRHFGIVPNFRPFDCDNFHTEHAQRAARSSNLLSRVLLSRSSQFLQKIFTLESIVDHVQAEFSCAVDCLAASGFAGGSVLWRTFDDCHFDLNTCLRETTVLLKSFLFVLPETQLSGVDFTIRGLCRSRRASRSVTRLTGPRRISASAGK